MEGKIKQFEQLIKGSEKILVTSHISPDPDAICSVLLLGTTIVENYHEKKIHMVLDEPPARPIDFLSGYGDIKFTNLYEHAKQLQPGLIILSDAMNYERVSRSDGPQLRELAQKLKSKLIIIDHHVEAGLEKNDCYINDELPATAQQVYDLLFNKLNLEKPDGYAQTTLLGIISDTARFKYGIHHYRATFALVSDLIDAGASIEQLENRLDRYSAAQMRAFSNLAKNITDSRKGYTYSFIDESVRTSSEKDQEGIKMAVDMFTNQFLRNFESNQWGFLVYPGVTGGKKNYSASFRALNGIKDVAAIAAKLGGGGHTGAAGAKGIMASDAQSAVKFVESIIEESK